MTPRVHNDRAATPAWAIEQGTMPRREENGHVPKMGWSISNAQRLDEEGEDFGG